MQKPKLTNLTEEQFRAIIREELKSPPKRDNRQLLFTVVSILATLIGKLLTHIH